MMQQMINSKPPKADVFPNSYCLKWFDYYREDRRQKNVLKEKLLVGLCFLKQKANNVSPKSSVPLDKILWKRVTL